MCVCVIKYIYIYIYLISIQPWRPGLARTRAQSFDRYGSGTLHLGQVLGGSFYMCIYIYICVMKRKYKSHNNVKCGSFIPHKHKFSAISPLQHGEVFVWCYEMPQWKLVFINSREYRSKLSTARCDRHVSVVLGFCLKVTLDLLLCKKWVTVLSSAKAVLLRKPYLLKTLITILPRRGVRTHDVSCLNVDHSNPPMLSYCIDFTSILILSSFLLLALLIGPYPSGSAPKFSI